MLERSIAKLIHERSLRNNNYPGKVKPVTSLLEKLSNRLRNKSQARYIANRARFLEKTKLAKETTTEQAIEWFNRKWKDLHTRLEIVPGKEYLRNLRSELLAEYAITLTDFRIISEFRATEIPADLVELIENLDGYRRT